MGIAETFLAGLYFNATCLNESFINHGVRNNLFQKEDYFKNLENELRGMHLTVATVQVGNFILYFKIFFIDIVMHNISVAVHMEEK